MSTQVESPTRLEKELLAKMNDMGRPCYPLHESVRERLHQQYVDFYNTYQINAQPSHMQPISTSRQNSVMFGGSPLLPVGHTEDIFISRRETAGPDVRVRCFVPKGEPPTIGWPILLYVRGGGWVLGDIDSENHLCTNFCVRSKCIVISPEYRLAPEHPFPAALHDCWETLLWAAAGGRKHLNFDTSKIAVSGSSAGANLAAAIVNKSLLQSHRVSIVSQLLIVPILDNTALPSNNTTWRQNEFTAALPAAKMLWYRDHYLPNLQDRNNPDASPTLFLTTPNQRASLSSPPTASSSDNCSGNVLASKIPPTFMVVGGMDILRQEAEDYAAMLTRYRVPTVLHIMEGMPHPFVALDQFLDDGKKAITLICEELNRIFALPSAHSAL